jgi:predicted amidohydrolase
MNVVAVQLDIAWEDRAANHRKVRALLSKAGVEPGGLIVLPEMFDTGFSMNVERAAQDESRPSEAFLRGLARELDAAVLAGVAGPVRGAKATNEAVAFAPDGLELVRYAKQQPYTPPGEHIKYAAGDGHRLFEWGGLKISPFVCYDLRFPELFRPAVREGAELIVVVASWPDVRSEHWVRLLQARAIENLAYVVGVNRCGTDPSARYDGRTAAFDPHGKCLLEADATEQVAKVEIDAGAVREWRKTFPALRDMRAFNRR